MSTSTNDIVFWKKIPKKGYFRSKTENMTITIQFFIFELVYVPNFSLNWQFSFFGQNLPKKGISDQQQRKRISSLNTAYSNYTRYQILALILWTKFIQKGYFWYQTKKKQTENHHRILNIRIRFCKEFQLKLTILIFWTKFAQKMYFWSKTEKVNINIEICIFELV